MKRLVCLIASTVMSLLVASCAAANDPQKLAAALQTALDAGDLDAATRLADLSGSPAIAHSMYLDSVIECSGEYRCKVTLAPMDDAFQQRLDAQAKQFGIETPEAEGLLVVESVSEDGSSTGSFKMPYARMDGTYRIASARYSDSQLADLRARTNDTLLQEMFDKGVANPETGTVRKDWATAAARLPEDGGPAGRSLVAKTTAMHEAVMAKDPDAALLVGDRLTGMLIGATNFEGNPVAMEIRQRKLQAMALTHLHDVRVVEGYSLDGLVILVIEARDGVDWVVRGPVLMMKDGEDWGIAGHNYVEYPAET